MRPQQNDGEFRKAATDGVHVLDAVGGGSLGAIEWSAFEQQRHAMLLQPLIELSEQKGLDHERRIGGAVRGEKAGRFCSGVDHAVNFVC